LKSDDRFLISPSPDGTTMTVRKRPTEQGATAFYLVAKGDGLVKDLRIELVSEFGEFFVLTELNKPLPLPVGRYRVSRCEFAIELNKANVWYYRFYSPKDEYTTTVEPGKTGDYELLPTLKLMSGLAKNRSRRSPISRCFMGERTL